MSSSTSTSVAASTSSLPAVIPSAQRHTLGIIDKNLSSTLDEVVDGLSTLKQLKLASYEHLAQQDRAACGTCGKRRKYFCYSCFEVIGDRDLVPRVTLPVHLDVVFYPSEIAGKATSLHAAVLAGKENVSVHTFPQIPKFTPGEAVVLYPTVDAVRVDEMAVEDLKRIKHVIVLDSQWQTVARMDAHESLEGLRRVKIRMYTTTFWRYQQVGPHCLATIEAIYYFYR
jgi:DTW domain-containing protein YfiP